MPKKNQTKAERHLIKEANMNNQFKNLSFNGSSNLKKMIVDQLITEVGTHVITLSNSEYIEFGGYRPYQLFIERHENGESSIYRMIECMATNEKKLAVSNFFDFETGDYYFEHVGKFKESQMGKDELEEIYDLFTNNLASFFQAGSYDSVEVRKI